MNVKSILKQLQQQRATHAAEISKLDKAIATLKQLGGEIPVPFLRAQNAPKKRKMSKVARARIAAAQKKRWKAWKAKKG